MDKSRRGIRNLYITSKNHPGLLGQFHRKSKNAVGVLHRPSQSLYYQEKTPIESTTVPDHAPYFLGLKYFKDNVAVSNTNAQFTYADLFNRSFYLSLEIKKALRNHSSNQNQAISLICPNGISFVIGQWAIWMSGNVMVPLSGQNSTEALEYFVKDSQSQVVITADPMLEKVENVAKKTEKPLICVDINNANQTHEIDFKESSIYQNLIFNPDLYQNQMDQPVMMLYLPGDKNKKVAFDHRDINDELNYVSNSWNLDENTAMLHSLSMYHTFGLVATLMTPLSVGGSVTILPEFDTLKVWAHLLGINGDNQIPPRINHYAAVPAHFEALIKRYEELFKDSKTKKFVLDKCGDRIKSMIAGNGYTTSLLDFKTYTKWHKITSHHVKSY